MPTTSAKTLLLEATVTSKGQITLPAELRKRLGLHKGSRVRFSVPSGSEAKMEPVRYRIEDLWELADKRGPAGKFMSFEEMNEAKARRSR